MKEIKEFQIDALIKIIIDPESKDIRQVFKTSNNVERKNTDEIKNSKRNIYPVRN